MTAKIQTRLVDSTRPDLKQFAPLETPFVLMVDPSSICNFRCRFCPTGDRELIRSIGRQQGLMELAAFQKIVDDLQDFDRHIKVLRLYKEGEPLMNKALPEMIKYARQSGRIDRIDTTTNGALLSPGMSERLIEAGIDQINISVNGINDGQFTEYTRTSVSFAKYVENIRYLYQIKGKCEIYIKSIKENLSEDDQKTFMDTFGDIADRIFLEDLFPAWPGFESDEIPVQPTVGHYGQKVVERKVCPFVFYMMVIASDGSVCLCVSDWARKAVTGSVLEKSVREIWLGELMNSHRLSHLEGHRMSEPVCDKCDVISCGVFDNVDSDAVEIRERLLAGEYY